MLILRFIKALYKSIRAKCPRVLPEEREARLRICEQCQHYSFEGHPRCMLCGCFLELKTWCKTEDCPKNLWTLKAICKEKGSI